MEIMLKKVLTLILLGFAITACSTKPDCMIADSMKELKNESLNKKGLHLYLRTSGFGEKEHFYELFKQMPPFDKCGMTTIDTLSQTHVDTSLGTPEKIIIKNNQIKIEYKVAEDASQLSNVIIASD